ncbi:MAG: conjugative transfer protein MobI(A/C) [Lamprobacter sp.]|uniref:conjugative transfer protein MobI(A/C) n=1 Tax=Lamprobacter sp. TaxID=3100796 RepID=UPI002B260FDE|nr:conjugative transfer protein MobI(A/C) [Lamprobacter sp.]MEA3642307.1 conjugative transfer protein MobI(A/C) [Lamprobacter sp.]
MPDQPLSRIDAQVTRQGVAHRGKQEAETASAGCAEAPACLESHLFEELRHAFTGIRAELRLQAETLELEIMTRLRETRLLQPVGMRSSRLGMRVRKPRRPGGSFTLEWYRVRWRGRTDYIARGAGDRYGRKAFIGALAWERAIALDAEQGLSAIRRQLRLMSEIERRLQALQGLRAQEAPETMDTQALASPDGEDSA